MPYPNNVSTSMFHPPPQPPYCGACDEPCELPRLRCACGCGAEICHECRVRCTNCDDYYALGCTVFVEPDVRECRACSDAKWIEMAVEFSKGLEQYA